MRISLGVIIAVLLIGYWYFQDNPGAKTSLENRLNGAPVTSTAPANP